MKKRWRWLSARTWLALFLYWFLSMALATVAHSPSMIILTMLIMTWFCVFNPREPWPLWRKLAVVLGGWVAQAILQLLGLPVLLAVGGVDSKEKADRLFMFCGALPVVLYAMRHSRLFVAPKAESPEPLPQT